MLDTHPDLLTGLHPVLEILRRGTPYPPLAEKLLTVATPLEATSVFIYTLEQDADKRIMATLQDVAAPQQTLPETHTTFNLHHYHFIKQLFQATAAPVFVENVAESTQLETSTRRLLQSLQAAAGVYLMLYMTEYTRLFIGFNMSTVRTFALAERLFFSLIYEATAAGLNLSLQNEQIFAAQNALAELESSIDVPVLHYSLNDSNLPETCLYASPAAVQLAGESALKTRSLSPTLFIHADDLPMLLNQVRALPPAGQALVVTCRTRPQPDSPERWFDLHCRRSNHNTLYITARDITTRHEALNRLNQSHREERQRHNLLRLTASLTREVVIHMDDSGVIQYVSPAAPRLLGYPEKELLHRAFYEFLTPEDRADLQKKLQMAPENWPETVTSYHWQPGNQAEPITLRTGWVYNKRGDEKGWITVSRNVHDEYLIQETLDSLYQTVAGYEELDRIATHAADMLFRCDASGQFIYISPVMERMLGFQPRQYIGQYLYTLIHPDDADRVAAQLQNTRDEVITLSFRFLRNTRQQPDSPPYIHIECTFTWQAETEERGKEITGIARDVTHRTRISREVTRKSKLHETIFEMADSGIFFLDTEYQIFGANPGLQRLLDTGLDGILNRYLQEFIAPDELEKAINSLSRLHKSVTTPTDVFNHMIIHSGIYRDNHTLLVASGKNTIVDLAVLPLPGDDELPDGYLGIATNITHHYMYRQEIIELNEDLENQTQELQAANRELREYPTRLIERLSDPIRFIRHYSGILIDSLRELPADSPVHNASQRLETNIDRLETINQRIIRLEKILQYHTTGYAINIPAMVKGVWDRLQQDFPGKMPALHIQPGIPDTRGDPYLINELFYELLHNALKFTASVPDARIEVRGKTEGGIATYSIRDNGIGFNLQSPYHEKIYQHFGRQHKEAEGGGVGLGLSIAQYIVMHHNGVLWGESGEGQTTFYFTLNEIPVF